jgi:hypothetical protein
VALWLRRAASALSSLGFLFFFLSLLLSFLGRVGMVVRSAAALAEAELDVLHSSLRPRSIIIVDPPPLVEEEDEEDEEVVPELPVNWWRIFSFTPSSFCLSIFSSNFADEFCAIGNGKSSRARSNHLLAVLGSASSFLLVLAALLTNNSSLGPARPVQVVPLRQRESETQTTKKYSQKTESWECQTFLTF